MGNVTPRRITCVADLTEIISDISNDHDGPIWYRGQANQSWSLLPGFYRYSKKLTEQSLLMKFRQSATMLLEHPPSDSFEWMFLMQHYGVPTRLLDWSESPLAALHFCVRDDADDDAALWVLKPSELNKNANINAKPEDGYLPSFQDDELQNYTIDSLRSNDRIQLSPIATLAVRNNPRIQAQLGVFTIHHHLHTPIEDVGDGTHVLKLRIAAADKGKIHRELRLLGFSQFQLFPELSSIGDILKDSMQ